MMVAVLATKGHLQAAESDCWVFAVFFLQRRIQTIRRVQNRLKEATHRTVAMSGLLPLLVILILIDGNARDAL